MCHFGRWTPLTPGKSCLPGLGLVVHAATYWWRPCWLEPRTSPDWNNSLYMGADKPYLITKLSMQKLPELLCIVFLLGVLVVWKLSPSESCLSISCRCSLPHISMLASWLGAFAPISMQMSGLPEASRTWNFPFCSEDRFQNLSQQEPFEVISLVHAVWSLKHPYGPNVETWNITKSGRMFGVWCRLFRVNSKGIYTLHTHMYIYI